MRSRKRQTQVRNLARQFVADMLKDVYIPEHVYVKLRPLDHDYFADELKRISGRIRKNIRA